MSGKLVFLRHARAQKLTVRLARYQRQQLAPFEVFPNVKEKALGFFSRVAAPRRSHNLADADELK
jgi:hypothetical protein